jgi:hypothetical protein
MSIPDHARANFQTLLRAAEDNNLALMECADAKTGETRYVICAVGATAPIMCSRHLGISPTGTPMTPISRRPKPCHPNRQPDPLSRLDPSGHGVSRVNGQAVPASSGWRCVTRKTLPRPVASRPRRPDQEVTSDVQGSQQA